MGKGRFFEAAFFVPGYQTKTDKIMQFSLQKSIAILERTPQMLTLFLDGLDAGWTHNNEGDTTWSVYDVIGHLIHAEKTDWLVRAEVILSDSADKTFPPFDRFGHLETTGTKTLPQLLEEFVLIRKESLSILRSMNLTEDDLSKSGTHPAFGEVTLAQLLATWTVHDMNHISQIVRVMAYQYKTEVGPWVAYLRVLNQAK